MEIEQLYYQTPGHALAASIVLSVLDIAAVAARLYTRQKQKQKIKADDWLMLPALLFTVGIGVTLIYGVAVESFGVPTKIPEDFSGDPREILALASPQLKTMNTLQWTFAAVIPLAIGCTKASFVCFYLRIFSVNKRSCTHYLLVGMLVFVIIWTLAFFFSELFQCGLNFWAVNSSVLDLATQCPHTQILDIAVCSSDVAADLVIFAIPIPLVWRLNLSTPKKLAVCAVFLLGGVTIIASLLRLFMMVRLYSIGFDANEDGVLVTTGYLYWGMVECGIAVIAACLPSLQFMTRTWSWKAFTSSFRSLWSARSYDSIDASKRNPTKDSSGSEKKDSVPDEFEMSHVKGHEISATSKRTTSEESLV
ncbi:plasma membrane protein Pth11-like protein [Stachybotrys elegans]|uniref:Plasma membrane protein Pth11-like protein n=1 Tax=Stachybotrys elegans TaxID=80388 RepID=A0A8K0SXW4_9HYPO|nr:plasma membrane protein Pth11-like protein [Stachybotrys elegans]